jgi:hypothetical protein
VDHRQEVLEARRWQGEVGREVGLGYGGEFLGRQGLELEAALAAGHRHFLVGQRQRHVGLGQGTQDVDQLARGHGGGRGVGARADFGRGLNLDFKVGGGEAHATAVLAHQDVGEDGQGLAPFDDAADDLQRLQQRVAVGFDELHFFISS